MAAIVFPSQNDVGTTPGDGRLPTEANLSKWKKAGTPLRYTFAAGVPIQSQGGVVAGFEDLGSTGLSQDVANGIAEIQGHRVETDATETLALTDDTFNHVYLKLVKTSGLVTDAEFHINTGSTLYTIGTPPADSILLWSFQTVSGGVSNAFNWMQAINGTVTGHYAGDGTNSRLINLGYRPKLVYVAKRQSPFIAAWSDISVPIPSGVHGGMAVCQPTSPFWAQAAMTNDEHTVPSLDASGFLVSGAGPPQTEFIWHNEGSITHNPTSILSQASWNVNVAVSGAAVGDYVDVSFTEDLGDEVVLKGWVDATDNVRVVAVNAGSAASPNPAEGTLRAKVSRMTTEQCSLNDNGADYLFVAIS